MICVLFYWCLESWIHCNDSTVTLCSSDDVHRAQAYILVYARVWPAAAEPDETEMQCIDEDSDDDDDDDDDDGHILYSLPPPAGSSS